MEKITQVACEVEEVLAHTKQELVDKISPKVRSFFIEQSQNTNKYKAKYNVDLPLEKQDLLEETKGILTLFYKDYWCTEEEKIKLEKTLNENEIKYEEELRKKYHVDVFAENKKMEKQETNESNLPTTIQEKWYKKLFKKIKSLFWGEGEY